MRKILLTLTIALCLASLVQSHISGGDFVKKALYKMKGFESRAHKFGAKHFVKETELGLESHIYPPKKGLFTEKAHWEEYFKAYKYAKAHPEEYNLQRDEFLQCDRGEIPEYWKFFGQTAAILNLENMSAEYKTPCFEHNKFTLKIQSATEVEVEHVATGHKGLVCGDGLLLTNFKNYHMETVYIGGKHKYIFKDLDPEEVEVIKSSGMYVYRFCDKVVNLLPDVMKTYLLWFGEFVDDPNVPWIGSHPNPLQEWANINMIEVADGYQWKKRVNGNVFVNLDKNLIQSGDFFALIRFNGNDVATMYGSGSHAGHAVMAMWIDDELYMFESNVNKGWPKGGLQKNKWEDWLKYTQDAADHVTWMPLRQDIRDKFDAQRALDWFKSVEGMPYGFENFLYGWIDTPDKNMPPTLDPNWLPAMFPIVADASSKGSILFSPAMNKRLGTDNLEVYQIAEVLHQRNMTWADLFAIVEQDGWVYDGHYSYVCSAFVVALWKAGGLFDGMEVNAVEFTPKDIYQMDWIDINYNFPQNCRDANPDANFCQIMGEYKMEFPGASEVSAYSHMNEKCPTEEPLYLRTPGC